MADLDLNRTRACVPDVKKMMDRKHPSERVHHVTEVGVTLDCPLLAVAHYTGELFGYSEELNRLIKRLMRYYRVDRVIGQLPVSEVPGDQHVRVPRVPRRKPVRRVPVRKAL